MCGLIYMTMECDTVPKKSELAFKLLSAIKSLPATCLQNQEEWLDLIRAVGEVEAKGGDAATNIVISEKVCDLPLQYTNKLTPS